MVHISIVPETIFHIGSLVVTNTLIMSWVITLALCIFAILFSRIIKDIPGRLQNIVEGFIEILFSAFEMVTGDRETVKKFFPITATIFIYILIANWAGLIPGLASFGIKEIEEGHEFITPIFRSVYSDLNMPLAIAFIVVIMTQVVGLKALGKKYISKFLNFKSPIAFFTGILETISEFSKVISFTFRLFGNVFAGEVLLIIIAFLIPYIAPIPFLGMEIFVGLIQAVIFSVLSLIFLSMATVHEESH